MSLGANSKKGMRNNMTSKVSRNFTTFSPVEIMIGAAIIGLLATLVTPGYVKACKQSQDQRTSIAARQLAAAVNQWSPEQDKKDSDSATTLEAAVHMKNTWTTRVYASAMRTDDWR
jgi:Tfp pilus assembly protein PilE